MADDDVFGVEGAEILREVDLASLARARRRSEPYGPDSGRDTLAPSTVRFPLGRTQNILVLGIVLLSLLPVVVLPFAVFFLRSRRRHTIGLRNGKTHSSARHVFPVVGPKKMPLESRNILR